MYIVTLYENKDALYDPMTGNYLDFTFSDEDEARDFIMLWVTVKGYVAVVEYDPSREE